MQPAFLAGFLIYKKTISGKIGLKEGMIEMSSTYRKEGRFWNGFGKIRIINLVRIASMMAGIVVLISLMAPAYANASSIHVHKVDQYNNDVADVVFRLEVQGAGGTWDLFPTQPEKTTNDKGKVSWGDAPYGSYRLTEVSAPAGYVKSDPKEFEVDTGKYDIDVINELIQDDPGDDDPGDDDPGDDDPDDDTPSDDNPGDADDTSTSPTVAAAGSAQFDVSITKAVDKVETVLGDILTYTITYKNIGSDVLMDVQVADNIPAGTTYIDGSASSGGAMSADGKTLVWNIGELGVDAGGTVTFRALVNNDAPDVIDNIGIISARYIGQKQATVSTKVLKPVVAAAFEDATVVAASLPEDLPYTGMEMIWYALLSLALVFGGYYIFKRAI